MTTSSSPMTHPVVTRLPATEFDKLLREVDDYVTGPGEEWGRQIEKTGAVPQELWTELRERGYLSLAAPVPYGGRGLSFSQWMGLMERFSRAHGSLRMIVHVVNGTWRAMDQFATDE